VSIVRNGDAVDDVMRIALGNRAFFMAFDGTTAYIADASDWDAVDREMVGADAFDLAAVGGGVAEADNVAHFQPFFFGEASLL
jgi:hypothetical protein